MLIIIIITVRNVEKKSGDKPPEVELPSGQMLLKKQLRFSRKLEPVVTLGAVTERTQSRNTYRDEFPENAEKKTILLTEEEV